MRRRITRRRRLGIEAKAEVEEVEDVKEGEDSRMEFYIWCLCKGGDDWA